MTFHAPRRVAYAKMADLHENFAAPTTKLAMRSLDDADRDLIAAAIAAGKVRQIPMKEPKPRPIKRPSA